MSRAINTTIHTCGIFNIGDRVEWSRTNIDERKECNGVIIGWCELNIAPILLVEPDKDGITAIVVYLSALTKVINNN